MGAPLGVCTPHPPPGGRPCWHTHHQGIGAWPEALPPASWTSTWGIGQCEASSQALQENRVLPNTAPSSTPSLELPQLLLSQGLRAHHSCCWRHLLWPPTFQPMLTLSFPAHRGSSSLITVECLCPRNQGPATPMISWSTGPPSLPFTAEVPGTDSQGQNQKAASTA